MNWFARPFAGRPGERVQPSAPAIRNWVAQADRDEGRRSDGLTNAERIELSRLRKENKQLRLSARSLKSRGLVRSGDEGGSVEGFRFVSAHRAVFPIAAMCRVLGVSSSGYYAWAKRAPSARATSDAALIERIGAVHAASHGTYGSPRVHAELVESGLSISRKRVARSMKAASLAWVSRRRFVTTTVRDGGRQAPDLVERSFTAGAPDVLWVADITYIPTWSGFLYLAIVLDAFSRRIIGWSMSLTLHADIVLAALNMALAVRKPKSVIHHSDQGSQYTSIAFGNRCREAGVRPSMDRLATPTTMLWRELFRHARMRTPGPPPLQDPGRGAHGRVRLHRRLLQSTAQALGARLSVAYGVRAPARIMAQRRSPSSPGQPNHAPVLAPIKHKPSRARKTRVLDRDCAQRQSLRMGRDEGTGPLGPNEGTASTRRTTPRPPISYTDPTPSLSTKTGQVQVSPFACSIRSIWPGLVGRAVGVATTFEMTLKVGCGS